MSEIFAPGWIDRSQLNLPTGQKNAPLFSLPDNRIHTTHNRYLNQPYEEIIGRAGVNAILNAGVNGPIRFEWTHANIMGNAGKPAASDPYGPASLNEQDVINVAGSIPLSFIEGNELGEGIPWGMPYWAPQKRWFYQARKAMYDLAGIPYRSIGTYGGFEHFNGDPWLFRTDGNVSILPNSDQAPFKGFIQTTEGARNSCAYFSLFESLGVGACVKNYADTPDYAADYYRKKFAAEVMGKGMGKVGGIGPGLLTYLDWGNIESLGGSGKLHNGIYYQRTKPNGTVVSASGHPVVSYDWLMACNFCIGMCMTDGCTPFNDQIRFSSNPADDNYPTDPLAFHDSTFEAAYRYAQTSRTAGRPWRYARYRFVGSETWIEPKSDGTTILDHASAFGGPYAQGSNRRGRPDIMFRDNTAGTALDWWAFDPSWGPENSQDLIVEPVPGHQYSITLRGTKLRQFRETL